MRFDPYNQYEDDDFPWWAKLIGAAVGIGLVYGLVMLLKWLEK